MSKYRDFIPQNRAPKGVKRIGIYDAQGKRVGTIPLGALAFPDVGEKLYSFGALSDVHIGYESAVGDFQRALAYLTDVDFICICGDLTGDGSDAQLAQYKALADGASVPVYAIAGNHEGMAANVEGRIASYTGHPLYYSFEHGNDVFIMLGTLGGESYSNSVVFANGELQWLRETLEANRNKRCFVFQHIFAGVAYATSSGYVTEAVCGNAGGLYTNWCWHDTAECQEFERLMKEYPNVIWFHGHSHLRYALQKRGQLYANYSEAEGYKEVHIPSLAAPRADDDGDGKAESNYAGSEGCVVDVYEKGIHLRGRDFVAGAFLPIASYWIDTALQTVEGGTYAG